MSSLTAAMWAGVSGLSVHSRAMSVVGNNLANSSTMGYKRSTVQFEDFVYTNLTTGRSVGQVGMGASIASIYGDFSQGLTVDSKSPTDLAISGNGFFMVRNPATGSDYYTRAGNFTFTRDGYLRDPNGYVVQGWKAYTDPVSGQASNVGGLGDIRLDSLQIPPSATTSLRMVTNLNGDAADATTDAADPCFALLKTWAGKSGTPLGDKSYAYQATIKVFDEAGAARDVTVYYDKVSNASGSKTWEFIVACKPEEDGRTLNGVKLSSTSSAGLLMAGTLSFDSAGNIVNMSAFTLGSNASGDFKNLSNWVPASFSRDGYPLLTPNFTATSNASLPGAANARPIKLDLGLRSTQAGGAWATGVTDASQVGTNLGNLPRLVKPKADPTTTTSYAKPFGIADQDQDGYTMGFLQDINVTGEGVVVGKYSNSRTKNLFVVGLANFNNLQGLRREGGNLFSKTMESGEARVGTAGTAGLGNIAAYKLEQSNVDTATEMVNMISYQRGFQANSKVISTTDTMLQEVIQLKR